MKTKIINQLKEIVDIDLISFHVPGHKLGKVYEKLGYLDIVKNIYKMDTTEISGTDNLHSPEGIIKESQDRAAQVFKSDKTYYLVNGSTCGIQSAIMGVCSPNDKIIVNRDCHQSVINACILGDIEPTYILPKINKETNILEGVDIKEVLETIDKNLDAKAILLTYPTYYGITYDLETICDYAHNRGMVVIVDEAHGSHLGLSTKLPRTALQQGADIVIQSAHKTLPSFTQSSMLHIKGDKVDCNKICSILRIIESSSPSYLLMASLDLAVDIYETKGEELMNDLLINIKDFEEKIKDNKLIDIYNEYDKTKIFISSKKLGITGYNLDTILRDKYNIQVELANYYGVLLICTIGNDRSDFKNMIDALNDISERYSLNKMINHIEYPMIIPEKVLNPREAFYKDKKNVKIYDSIGEVCGEYIIPYPPGISLLSPGEKISKEIIDYILLCNKKGMNISGIKDSNLEFIQIVKD
ncbi:aminotransferase class I/II-fold pyridoxal phosphate-dependent enzyme [Romboutsia lituseburensis]|uniref:aminotransferase class I/II-fold pyridoxal phosphate-dependent enzyme n=1 Tax=Romboutsia lituseburensis TaxID=1537 RepID=UPI00215A3D46|nr:aminotransferase class V-fold PLP-dependent enzyme [Romboutsia lituseburensis]MCR8745995.1 aminotransferase class V-fold PLP-dependent enzyme [Romboutsia lituseburensis]